MPLSSEPARGSKWQEETAVLKIENSFPSTARLVVSKAGGF
jgi:hypothetical protein